MPTTQQDAHIGMNSEAILSDGPESRILGVFLPAYNSIPN